MWKIIKFTLVVAVLLVTPWLTSVAYANSNSTSTRDGIRIEAAGQAAAPEATFLGSAYGSITPGDLFYIDATGSSHDQAFSLYITNAGEITQYLKYLILKVTVYSAGRDGQWQPVPSQSGSAKETITYLTLHNSPVKFIVPGDARYKITIDSGSYYCLPARTAGGNEPPRFYLTVEMV